VAWQSDASNKLTWEANTSYERNSRRVFAGHCAHMSGCGGTLRQGQCLRLGCACPYLDHERFWCVRILTILFDMLDHPKPEVAPRNGNWSQDRRLRFIDFRLQWDGKINRSDLRSFFGISVPQASKDISRYLALAPQNIEYDKRAKEYVAAPTFWAIYDTSTPQQYTAQLLGINQHVLPKEASLMGYEPPVASVPVPIRKLSSETLSALVRSIRMRSKLRIDYLSITREEASAREVSPHAFGFDGLRWHVRAYCHHREKFRDFVIGRISNIEGEKASEIDANADAEWERELEVVLAPYPKLSASAKMGVEADFGMVEGKVSVKCRQAMLYYFFRRLNLNDEGNPVITPPQIIVWNLEQLAPYIALPGQT
jgi:hypothetical protein